MGDAEFIKVARKIQVVEAVKFERPPQMWEIAQWMKAHKLDTKMDVVEFTYTVGGESRTLKVKRDWWIVQVEDGYATFNDYDFNRKFIIDKYGALDGPASGS